MKAPIPITRPCSADWSQMSGDDRRRFCAHCDKHVHNLSALTPPQIAQFVAQSDGTECIGYSYRPDGHIVTAPRWPWLHRLLNPFRHLRRGVAWFLALALPSLFAGCASNRCSQDVGGLVKPGGIAPPPPKTKTIRGTYDGQIVMGTVCPTPRQPHRD